MKTFVAVTLFVAFVAVVRATELANDPDKVGFVQCQKNLFNCFKDGKSTKEECRIEYKGCLAAVKPTEPQFITLCKKDLKVCMENALGPEAGCYRKYGVCLMNQGPLPDYVVICKEVAKTCYQNTSGLLNKAKCTAYLATCLANGGPTGTN